MDLQHDNDPWSTLLDVMRSVAMARDSRDLADRVARRLHARPSCRAAGVWLWNGEALAVLVAHGFDPVPAPTQIHRAAEHGTPIFVDPEAHSRDERALAQEVLARQPLAILPLPLGEGARGALVVSLSSDAPAHERALLEAIASHTALALRGLGEWSSGAAKQSLARPRASLPDAAVESTERSWDEFLSHAAHEIKNPLASIKGYADLLMRRASGDAAEPYRKGLTIIAQQVARTTSVLDQLSDLSQIGTERLRLDQHTADMAPIVRRVAGAYQSTSEQHQIQIDGADAEILIRCDEGRVGQIIDIMLNNAVKFSPGGGPIHVRVEQTGASEPAHGRHPEVIISVSDQGIGVPEGEQERVFERFFRGSNVAGAYRGLGISLYIARAIAERHGGHMWIESAAARGTTCHLALPLR